MTKQVTLEDRLEAVSAVLFDWLVIIHALGLALLLMVVFDGHSDQASTVVIIRLGVLALFAVPLLVLGAALCFLRLRRAWQTGE